MPTAPSPTQQAASRANGARSRGPATAAGKARAARNGTRHGLRGGVFGLLPGEDAQELDLLRQTVACDWQPRDAYERHWAAELVAAMWRQQRLRHLEFAALEAASQEHPPTEASLKRLLTFARYGARIDKELAQALRALRVLKGRPTADLAEHAGDSADSTTRTPEPKRPQPAREEPLPQRRLPAPKCTLEPELPSAQRPRELERRAFAPPCAASAAACTPEPKPPALRAASPPSATPRPTPPLNRHERRRREALARRSVGAAAA